MSKKNRKPRHVHVDKYEKVKGKKRKHEGNKPREFVDDVSEEPLERIASQVDYRKEGFYLYGDADLSRLRRDSFLTSKARDYSLVEGVSEDSENSYQYKVRDTYFLRGDRDSERGFTPREVLVIEPQVSFAVGISRERKSYHHVLVNYDRTSFYVEVGASGRVALPAIISEKSKTSSARTGDFGKTSDPRRIVAFKGLIKPDDSPMQMDYQV